MEAQSQLHKEREGERLTEELRDIRRGETRFSFTRVCTVRRT